LRPNLPLGEEIYRHSSEPALKGILGWRGFIQPGIADWNTDFDNDNDEHDDWLDLALMLDMVSG
jgi:hypothetical protein